MPVYFGERLEAPPRKFFTATAGVSLVLFLFGASAAFAQQGTTADGAALPLSSASVVNTCSPGALRLRAVPAR